MVYCCNAALSISVEFKMCSEKAVVGVHERREVIRNLGHNFKFIGCCALLKPEILTLRKYVCEVDQTQTDEDIQSSQRPYPFEV